MNHDLYRKLVDVYADQSLSEEMVRELDTIAETDPDLRRDIDSLVQTVQALRNPPALPGVEESLQRVLIKMYARGVDTRPKAPEPLHLQYQLPISG